MATLRHVYRSLSYATEGTLEIMSYKVKKYAVATRRVFRAIARSIEASQMRRANELVKMMGYDVEK